MKPNWRQKLPSKLSFNKHVINLIVRFGIFCILLWKKSENKQFFTVVSKIAHYVSVYICINIYRYIVFVTLLVQHFVFSKYRDQLSNDFSCRWNHFSDHIRRDKRKWNQSILRNYSLQFIDYNHYFRWVIMTRNPRTIVRPGFPARTYEVNKACDIRYVIVKCKSNKL